MNAKKVRLLSLVFMVTLFGTLLASGSCFSETPTYVDPPGDEGGSPHDLTNIWIDNDATFLRFKMDIGGPLNDAVSPIFLACISVDNATGYDYGWDVPIDYIITFAAEPGLIAIELSDQNDGSNSLYDTSPKGLSYHQLSNNNQTLEFGYKLQTSYGGQGYLNISIGQVIYLRFWHDQQSDYAPDEGNSSIRYVLKEEGLDPLLLFMILFFPSLGLALGIFIYYRRKAVI